MNGQTISQRTDAILESVRLLGSCSRTAMAADEGIHLIILSDSICAHSQNTLICGDPSATLE